ncbi:hypothetical protein CP533_5015 [Ophiocordyceps camponoti-saundersi (nom. inval.)]|nr:hypothetical protein CP533_5015 [Ophiocordyceps camponoti-saundersi (nom. inval.)]
MDGRREELLRRRAAANIFAAVTAVLLGCAVIYWLLAKRRMQAMGFTKTSRPHEMGGFYQGQYDGGAAPRSGQLAILPAYGESLPSEPPPAYGSWTGRLLRPLTMLPGRHGSVSHHSHSSRDNNSNRDNNSSRNNSSSSNTITEEANVGLASDAQSHKEQAQQ